MSAIRRVVIVGASSGAWLSAAALKRALRHRQLEVIVLDIGPRADAALGMWTLPSLPGLHGLIGIREPEFMQRTGATFKLAVEHKNWQGEGSRFLHAHGEIGTELNGTPFYKYLLLQKLAGRTENSDDYSLAGLAARAGRFARPMSQTALTSSFTYAFHLNEAAYCAYVRAHAEKSGVQRYAGNFVDVSLDESGNVAALILENGARLDADYFLDCSGREALLINRVSRHERDDWSPWLPNDRLLSMRAPAIDAPPAMTQTIADRAGWLWRMPLAQSSLAGHVYCSAFISDEEAVERLTNGVAGCSDPTLQRLSSGRRKVHWHRNCVAFGDSAIELEPLVGASMHIVELGIANFIELFPIDTHSQLEAVEYNRILGDYADALRDFTIAHYRAGRERGGEYWVATRAAPPPQRFADKLDHYRASGRINLLDNESFEEVDWAWLLLGSGCLPERIELHVQTTLQRVRADELTALRASIEKLAASMPRHIDFLNYQSRSPA